MRLVCALLPCCPGAAAAGPSHAAVLLQKGSSPAAGQTAPITLPSPFKPTPQRQWNIPQHVATGEKQQQGVEAEAGAKLQPRRGGCRAAQAVVKTEEGLEAELVEGSAAGGRAARAGRATRGAAAGGRKAAAAAAAEAPASDDDGASDDDAAAASAEVEAKVAAGSRAGGARRGARGQAAAPEQAAAAAGGRKRRAKG